MSPREAVLQSYGFNVHSMEQVQVSVGTVNAMLIDYGQALCRRERFFFHRTYKRNLSMRGMFLAQIKRLKAENAKLKYDMFALQVETDKKIVQSLKHPIPKPQVKRAVKNSGEIPKTVKSILTGYTMVEGDVITTFIKRWGNFSHEIKMVKVKGAYLFNFCLYEGEKIKTRSKLTTASTAVITNELKQRMYV